MSTIAAALAAASRSYLLVGTGLVLRCRRPADEDLRALGGEVLRGAVIGQQALSQAAHARAQEWSRLPESERATGEAERAVRDLTATATQLDADPEHRARADGLWRAYLCAAVEAAAVAPGLACATVELLAGPPEGVEWEPLTLVPQRAAADPEQSRLYIGDLLSWPARMVAHLLLAAQEATPPLVAAFRGPPGVTPAAGSAGAAVQGAAQPDSQVGGS